jgi:hypothetical protein
MSSPPHPGLVPILDTPEVLKSPTDIKFDGIPYDIIQMIASTMGYKAIKNYCQVNTTMRLHCENDDFWRTLLMYTELDSGTIENWNAERTFEMYSRIKECLQLEEQKPAYDEFFGYLGFAVAFNGTHTGLQIMFDSPIEPRHVIIGDMMAPDPNPGLKKPYASLSVTERVETDRMQAYRTAMTRALFRIEFENGNTRKAKPAAAPAATESISIYGPGGFGTLSYP